MLAGTVAALSLTGCKNDDPVDESIPNWQIAGNEIVNIKPERTKMLRNPLTGWVTYAGLGDGLNDTFWDDYDNM